MQLKRTTVRITISETTDDEIARLMIDYPPESTISLASSLC
jgi:hypothetical protein